MNFSCQSCNSLIVIPPGDRPPPWCSKCGADFKPDDQRFAALAESRWSDRVPPPAPPAPPAPEAITRVTGTGPKGWLKKDAPPGEPEAVATEAEPPPAKPMPATDPDREWTYGIAKAGGVILLLVAGCWTGTTWTFARSAGNAPGHVAISNTDFDFATVQSDGRTEPVSVVRYTAGGKEYEFPAPNLEAGTAVEVLYPQDDPARGRRADPMILYRWPALVAVLGAGLLAGAAAATGLLARRRTQAFGDTPAG